VQTSLRGQSLESPISGVVAAWNVRTFAPTGSPRLRVLHRVAPGEYRAGAVTSGIYGGNDAMFPTGIAISRGDRIAVELDQGERIGVAVGAMDENGWDWLRPALFEGGASASVTEEPSRYEVVLNATIEPDADGDGFGDDTWDQCPQSAASSQPCPPHGQVGVRASKPVVIADDTLTLTVGLRTGAQQLQSSLHVQLPPQLAARAAPEGCSILTAEVVCEMFGWPSAEQIDVAAVQPGIGDRHRRDAHRRPCVGKRRRSSDGLARGPLCPHGQRTVKRTHPPCRDDRRRFHDRIEPTGFLPRRRRR
jgi:hypothetical protein